MKVPETVSSGITVFTNSLLLPNPGVDHAIIYTDTRLFRSVSFRFVSPRGSIFYSNFNDDVFDKSVNFDSFYFYIKLTMRYGTVLIYYTFVNHRPIRILIQ